MNKIISTILFTGFLTISLVSAMDMEGVDGKTAPVHYEKMLKDAEAALKTLEENKETPEFK